MKYRSSLVTALLTLGVAALLFGFPIFFDAGLVVFLPIILTVARRFGGSVLYYALPAAGGFAAMHALVPPHPGPVAAGTQLRCFSKEIMDAGYKASMEVFAAHEAKSPEFRKIHQDMRAFQRDQVLWSKFSEWRFDSYIAGLKL